MENLELQQINRLFEWASKVPVKEMRDYHLSIKSNTEIPIDYEDSCEAKSKEEAAKIFFDRMYGEIKNEWSPENLLEFIE